MFTGIVQCVGGVTSSDLKDRDLRLIVNAGQLSPHSIRAGDSVAVNGVCLTVVTNNDYHLRFDVSAETLSVSTLGRLVVGSKVNLELALTAWDRLGGHIVSGHVDGVGKLDARQAVGGSEKLVFTVPQELHRYIAQKGSVCVDGVSLTVNALTGNGFTVNIVPHTLRMTTLGQIQMGQKVNIEVDIIARYLERLLEPSRTVKDSAPADEAEAEGITKQFLTDQGFMAPDVDQDDNDTAEDET